MAKQSLPQDKARPKTAEDNYRTAARLHPNAIDVKDHAVVRRDERDGQDGAWVDVASVRVDRQPWGRSAKHLGLGGWEIYITANEAAAGELS